MGKKYNRSVGKRGTSKEKEDNSSYAVSAADLSERRAVLAENDSDNEEDSDKSKDVSAKDGDSKRAYGDDKDKEEEGGGEEEDDIEESENWKRPEVSVSLCMWEFGQNDPKRDSGSKLRRLGYSSLLKLGQSFPGNFLLIRLFF